MSSAMESMREELDLHFVEDNHSPGRIFFQIQSGNPFNQCHIESFGSLCIVHGKLVVRPDNSSTRKSTTIPFECAFDSGLHINRKELFHDIPHEKVPTYLEAKSLTIIKSTQFPPSCPVESITLEALSGVFYTDDLHEYTSRSKSIVVIQAAVKFKPYNAIYPEVNGSKESWVVEEVLFDFMTLFNAKVILPRGFKRRKMNNSSFSNNREPFYDARLGHSPPPVGPIHRRETLNAAIARALLRRRLLLEIFTLFFIIALWFVLFPKSFAARFWVLSSWNRSVWATLGALLTIVAFLRWKFPTNSDGNVVTVNHIPFNGRSFFVNGWQSWSFCGSILHGEKPPIYSMPSLFVRSFHDGGEGTALRINLGEGRIPFKVVSSPTLPYRSRKDHHHHHPHGEGLSSPVTPGSIKRQLFDAENHPQQHHAATTASSSSSSSTNNLPRLSKAEMDANKDYIASDMFTLLSDLRSQYGVMMGFVSQRQQFGCIATNRHYDRLTVHVSGDGVLIPNAGVADSSNLLMTDPLMLYVTNTLENPFLSYMQMSNKANQVDALYTAASATLSTPPSSLSDRSFSFPLPPPSALSYNRGDSYYRSSPGTHNSDTGSSSSSTASSEEGFPLDRIPVGWCSWYHFYEHISETILLNNLQRMKQHQETNHLGSKRVGFQLFQIDDGYQRYWGDWLDIHPRYTSSRSLQTTVNQLKQGGFLGGLWLAPFAADKQATIIRQSPEWILRQGRRDRQQAKPCNSANCGKFFYGLDVTHPTYQRYLYDCLQTVTREWGFRYLKLDFLYAAVLPQAQPSFYQRTLTKAQVMQVGMQTIRHSLQPSTINNTATATATATAATVEEQCVSPVFIVGCGAPLGSVIGHVHANRISADMGLTWNPSFPLPSQDTWNLPCARNAVRNTLTRMFMHRHWWINDPDCLMLRETLSFTEAELLGIATVKALSGGSLLLSDDFDQVSSRRMRILQKLLPPTDQAAVAVDIAYRETPELLRLVLQSTYSRRMQHWLRANSGSYSGGGGGGMMSRGTSEAFHDADYHFHVAMSPSNDEYFPWDAGMTTNLYECFQHRESSLSSSGSAYPPPGGGGGHVATGGPRSRANSFGGGGGGGGVGGGIGGGGGWGTEESCDSSSPDESGGDSPVGSRSMAKTHPHQQPPLLGAFSPPLGNSPGAPSGAKSLSSSSAAAAKHSPFLISAHKQNATKDVMTQIRSKYLDKRDLLKRWYVFAACFWTEQADVKNGEQMAASMDITLSHEQFYQDVSPVQRRRAMAAAATAGGGFAYTKGGTTMDEDLLWSSAPSSSGSGGAGFASAGIRGGGGGGGGGGDAATSKGILINVQSSRAVRLSQQKRRRQEYFAQYLSNSAFYEASPQQHPSTGSWLRDGLQRAMSSLSSSSLSLSSASLSTGAAKMQSFKTHFVHVRDIFGADDLAEMVAYTKYLYRHQLKRRERHIEKSYQNIRMTLSSNDELWAQRSSSTQQAQNGVRASTALSVDAHDDSGVVVGGGGGGRRRGALETQDFLGPTARVDSFDQRHDDDRDDDDDGEGDDGLGTLPPPSLFDTPPMNRHRRKSMGTSLFGPEDTAHTAAAPRGSLFTPPSGIKPSASVSLPSSVASASGKATGGGGGGGGSLMMMGLPPHVATPQTPHTLHLGISHVLHMFNFWEEEYAYKVVTLDDEEGGGEVAFTDIPLHSASLYSMHVSLHPLIPKYLGSNLHFTGGLEVKQAYLMEAPIEMKRALEAMSYAAMSKRKSRSNVFASPTSSSIFQPHPTAAAGPTTAMKSAWHQSFSSSSDSDAGGSSAGNSFSGMVGAGVLHLTGGSNSFGGRLMDGTAAAAGVLHSHTPKIQCMRIDFEDGVLKDAAWGGHVWVFLPVNIHATRHYPHLLGRLQVMGDAVHHLTPNDLSPSVPRTKSTTTTLSSSSSSSTPSAALVPDEIEIVEYIDEISCLTAGYVYKIPVSLPPTTSSSTAYNIPGGSSGSAAGRADTATATASGSSSSSSSSSNTTQLPPKAPLKLEVPPPPKVAHHVVIAWIYDVIENK